MKEQSTPKILQEACQVAKEAKTVAQLTYRYLKEEELRRPFLVRAFVLTLASTTFHELSALEAFQIFEAEVKSERARLTRVLQAYDEETPENIGERDAYPLVSLA